MKVLTTHRAPVKCVVIISLRISSGIKLQLMTLRARALAEAGIAKYSIVMPVVGNI
jgi:hypothetical protein